MSIFSVHSLLHLIETGGPALVGVFTAIEAMGIPVPAESLLVACGIYSGTTGHLSIGWVVTAAAIGAILGDNIGFLIGRTLGLRALRRWGGRVGLTEDRMLLGAYLFRCHGSKVVILGRFVAVLRTFAALLAGANRMEWPRFMVANAAGGILWACVYGFGAYFLGAQVKHIAGPVGIALGIVTAAAIIAAVIYVRRNEQRLIEQAKLAAVPAL